jgi:hypothetical protein
MKIRKLVAFGCSWTYGESLIDINLQGIDLANPNKSSRLPVNSSYRLSHCYAGLVAEHYGVELENLACFGGSLESTRHSLIQWMNSNSFSQDTLLLVGLTDPSRQSWFNGVNNSVDYEPYHNKHIHSAWLAVDNDKIDQGYYNLQKLWLATSYDKDWDLFNLHQTLNLFDYVNSWYGLPVLQYNMLTDIPDQTQNIKHIDTFVGESNFRDWLQYVERKNNVECFVNDSPNPYARHPNEHGHKLIADQLIKYIEHKFDIHEN